jgi:4-hydroxythreonine-4-phosphate dehydrogenase
MGDPAGIGPEIAAKVFADDRIHEVCRPLVIGDAGVLGKIVSELNVNLVLRQIASPAEADPGPGRMDVIDLRNVNLAHHVWGRPNVASGKAVVDYIKRATELALRHEISAIATAPINKEMMNAAGFSYSGHTELFAELTGSKDYGMMFFGGGLRLILVTIHQALKDVPKLITKDSVLAKIRLAHKALLQCGIDRPRIGVAGLNPHAGEGGLFGTEEWDEILPAVLEARGEGINALDPEPADTLFHKAQKGHCDIVVAMYHDQGLAPLKMIAFGSAVNVTVGLPIIRTSVDHGTAYDIAGKNCADPTSLVEAIRLAARLAGTCASAQEPRK